MNNTIKVTFDNSRNIFFLNETKDSKRIFDLKFKNFFGFSAPSISKFNSNENNIVLWARKNT